MQTISECPNCGADSKLKSREFSSDAWSALLHWGEINDQVVASPICEDCYSELRDVLIDRADEVHAIVAKGSEVDAERVA